MSTDHAPLTDAELDQLDALNRARTPGRLCVASSAFGKFALFGGPDGEEWIATLAHAREADARAIAAALNALPALLAEVRAGRSALRFGEHVRARDAEGRYVQGWIVALDAAGRVQLDIVTGASERSGHVTEWLTAPERCAVYVRPPSPFEPRIASSDDDDAGPRIHIPADLLTRPAGGGVR